MGEKSATQTDTPTQAQRRHILREAVRAGLWSLADVVAMCEGDAAYKTLTVSTILNDLPGSTPETVRQAIILGGLTSRTKAHQLDIQNANDIEELMRSAIADAPRDTHWPFWAETA